VGSQISGQVRDLHADFNATVVQGQVIARIDPETYEARLAQAQADAETTRTLVPTQHALIDQRRADLENARAEHETATAQTLRADLALRDAEADLERKRQLAHSAVVSAGDWERAKNAYGSAQAQLVSSRAQERAQSAKIQGAAAALHLAQAQLETNLAQVKQKEVAIRQAQIDLERTYIRAPVTGTVVNRSVNRGQTVAASLQAPVLFTIAQDLTRMQVEAAVVEADVARFAVGQAVTFTVDAHPGRTFAGTVTQVRKAPQVVQNVVTYVVVMSAENRDEALLPGMTANLQVVVAERTNVLTVPNAALRFRPPDLPAETPPGAALRAGAAGADRIGVPGRVFVAAADGRPTAVPLRLGSTDGRATEVLAGDLAEGDAVITGAAPAEPGGSGALNAAWLRRP